jgi:hypothetical protein
MSKFMDWFLNHRKLLGVIASVLIALNLLIEYYVYFMYVGGTEYLFWIRCQFYKNLSSIFHNIYTICSLFVVCDYQFDW